MGKDVGINSYTLAVITTDKRTSPTSIPISSAILPL